MSVKGGAGGSQLLTYVKSTYIGMRTFSGKITCNCLITKGERLHAAGFENEGEAIGCAKGQGSEDICSGATGTCSRR